MNGFVHHRVDRGCRAGAGVCSSALPEPEMITTRNRAASGRRSIRSSTSLPRMQGISSSSTSRTSPEIAVAAFSASQPSAASTTEKPSSRSKSP